MSYFFSFQNSSNHRMRSLESLLDFMQVATKELMWLNEREEMEVSRDWSAKTLNLREIQEYYEVCIKDGVQACELCLKRHTHISHFLSDITNLSAGNQLFFLK